MTTKYRRVGVLATIWVSAFIVSQIAAYAVCHYLFGIQYW